MPAFRLDLLHSFVVVAEELSVSGAAGRLHVTPSAVSRRLRLLEKELGCVLFARHTRAMELTAPGETVLEAARDLLASLSTLTAAASGSRAARAG